MEKGLSKTTSALDIMVDIMPQRCQLNEINGETHIAINYNVRHKQLAEAGNNAQENFYN